jgi:MYXO-CTERM domain-containing protein
VNVPLSAKPGSQGARLFLNALFEADCVTSAGQPDLRLALQGPTLLRVPSLPATGTFTGLYANSGAGSALDAVLLQGVPADAAATGFEPDGQAVAGGVSWALGSIGSPDGQPGDPSAEGSRWTELRFEREGEYQLELQLSYRVGVSALQAEPARLTVRVEIGEPLDGGDDGADGATGDGEDGSNADGDGSDDDGSALDGGDGGADEGGGDTAADDCGCASGTGTGPGLWLLGLLALALLRRR